MSFAKMNGQVLEGLCLQAVRCVASAKHQYGAGSQQVIDAMAVLDHFCDHLFEAEYPREIAEDGTVTQNRTLPFDSERMLARLQAQKARCEAIVAAGGLEQSDELWARKKRGQE